MPTRGHGSSTCFLSEGRLLKKAVELLTLCMLNLQSVSIGCSMAQHCSRLRLLLSSWRTALDTRVSWIRLRQESRRKRVRELVRRSHQSVPRPNSHKVHGPRHHGCRLKGTNQLEEEPTKARLSCSASRLPAGWTQLGQRSWTIDVVVVSTLDVGIFSPLASEHALVNQCRAWTPQRAQSRRHPFASESRTAACVCLALTDLLILCPERCLTSLVRSDPTRDQTSQRSVPANLLVWHRRQSARQWLRLMHQLE